MLICYPGDAKALLEAMLQAGFMDNQPLRVHDWHEYNGVLDFFSKRAKKAAEARWEKERSKEKDLSIADQSVPKHSRSEASIASSIQAGAFEHKIREIHLWYSETRGGEIKLDEFSRRLWFEFFKAGHSEDDFKRVFKSKNGMVLNGDHPAALHLKNLLAPDRFPDFLADAKSGVVKQPRSGAAAPKDNQFIRDLEREVRNTK